ncbi:branched-chain amino acid ABC transporter permease, partial [bacterium]
METLSQLVLNSIIAGAIYTLVAVGFNLIFGAVKFFNLAHGVLAAFGGYLVFFLANAMGFNVYLSVPVAVICSGLAGFAFEKIIFLPLRRRKASNMVLLVASLGLMTSFQAVLAIIFSSQFQTLTGESARQTIFNIGGGAITLTQVVIAALGAGVTVFLIILLNKTMFGKAVKAISDDEEVAKIVGINTDKVIGRVFFIGSAIAGLSGILSGF